MRVLINFCTNENVKNIEQAGTVDTETVETFFPVKKISLQILCQSSDENKNQCRIY